jgi:hypothetical protein
MTLLIDSIPIKTFRRRLETILVVLVSISAFSCAKLAVENRKSACNESTGVGCGEEGPIVVSIDGDITANTEAVVSWTELSLASSYDVVFASDDACANTLKTYTDLRLNSLSFSIDAGTYYICVEAKDSAGKTIGAMSEALKIVVTPSDSNRANQFTAGDAD